ncbi:MAG: hypothetical protein KC468_03985 [Myxococcales bacterium]|nr:hypothetical protein [Myxococcales bacterium]
MHRRARALLHVALVLCASALGCLEPTPGFGETLTDAETSTTSAPATDASSSATSSGVTSDATGATSSGATSSGATSSGATTASQPCDGACDPVLELCNEAAGECECRPDFERCGDTCVNLVNDHGHCGACDVGCANNQTCSAGECLGPQCDGGLQKCDKSCVEIDSDVLHCGECSNPCPATQTCVMGECVD